MTLPRKLFQGDKSVLLNNLRRKKNDSSKEFKLILEFALSVQHKHEKRNIVAETHPLIDVIRLIGRKLQTKYLTHLIYCEEEAKLPYLSYPEVMFETKYSLTSDGKYFSDLKKEVHIDKRLQLGRDLILPWPWQRDRLINCITNIGEGRVLGSWNQDELNHNVELWLPLGIGWVNGGNHSIATGIIQGNGVIKPTYIFDITEVYEHVYTDGVNYLRKHDNSVISPVNDIEFAAIFEIGRIMKENAISF